MSSSHVKPVVVRPDEAARSVQLFHDDNGRRGITRRVRVAEEDGPSGATGSMRGMARLVPGDTPAGQRRHRSARASQTLAQRNRGLLGRAECRHGSSRKREQRRTGWPVRTRQAGSFRARCGERRLAHRRSRKSMSQSGKLAPMMRRLFSESVCPSEFSAGAGRDKLDGVGIPAQVAGV